MASKSTTKTLQELNSEGVTLVIPRIFPNISWKRVKKHMIEANLGFVERVDLIPIINLEGKVMHKRAFVHFAPGRWNMRDNTVRTALEVLSNGKSIELEYDPPWFWKVYLVRKSSKRPSLDAYRRPRRNLSSIPTREPEHIINVRESNDKKKKKESICSGVNCSIQGGRRQRRTRKTKRRTKRRRRKRRKTRKKKK